MPSRPSTASPNGVAESPRTRRPRGEPRRLLLDAARSVFNRKGYSNASTREIADAANVSETLMFRYFGSKAGLFREAMVQPFVELVDREISRRLANPQRFDQPREEARAFVADMFDVFHSHRALAASLFASDVLGESELAESGVLDEVRAQIERLVQFGTDEATTTGRGSTRRTPSDRDPCADGDGRRDVDTRRLVLRRTHPATRCDHR